MKLDLARKLAILSDAAKYDASCASSGTERRDSRKGGIGSTGGSGICHAYTPDGRCVSLLKILMTNFCIFDCVYCVNRVSSNVERARFSVEEVVSLTLEFYRRNYIEGLFLSSGIIRSPDQTMADMVRIARTLREDHGFKGYIHLKTIPDASPELIDEAGLYADRLSINIELPQDASIRRLAPEKRPETIRGAMARVRIAREASRERSHGGKRPARFAPAGQSTQMIVGADGASDATILDTSARLYAGYGLKRVYYSAFSPIPDASAVLPLVKPPLLREHRLYQADWLMRFYGFEAAELAAGDGMLDLAVDPKLAWALAHREAFPVDVNRAPQGGAAAGAGLRHEDCQPHAGGAAAAAAPLGRPDPHRGADGKGEAFRHPARLVARRADRQRRPASPLRPAGRAVEPVLMHRVMLPPRGTAMAWREAARALAAHDVPASQVEWIVGDAAEGALFDAELLPSGEGRRLTTPRAFPDLAGQVLCHRDPQAPGPALSGAAAAAGPSRADGRSRRPADAAAERAGEGGAPRHPQDARLRALPRTAERTAPVAASPPGSSPSTTSSRRTPPSSPAASPTWTGRYARLTCRRSSWTAR